jgi:hypothetical protein
VILCAEFGQTLNTKVVDVFNTFPESIYSLILVEYSGSYDYWKFTVRFCEFQYSVNAFSLGGRLNCLEVESVYGSIEDVVVCFLTFP